MLYCQCTEEVKAVGASINALYFFSKNKYFDSNLKSTMYKNKVDVDYETSLTCFLSKIVILQPEVVFIDDKSFAEGYDFLNLFSVDSPFFVPSVILLTDECSTKDIIPQNIFILDKHSYLDQAILICNKQIESRFFYKIPSYLSFCYYDTINTILREIGINPKSSGTIFLRDCINLVISNGCKATCFNKSVYSNIATYHNTSVANVERCIRSALNTAWTSTKIKIKAQFDCHKIFNDKPTVKELIYYIANYIKDREIENKFKNTINPCLIEKVSNL